MGSVTGEKFVCPWDGDGEGTIDFKGHFDDTYSYSWKCHDWQGWCSYEYQFSTQPGATTTMDQAMAVFKDCPNVDPIGVTCKGDFSSTSYDGDSLDPLMCAESQQPMGVATCENDGYNTIKIRAKFDQADIEERITGLVKLEVNGPDGCSSGVCGNTTFPGPMCKSNNRHFCKWDHDGQGTLDVSAMFDTTPDYSMTCHESLGHCIFRYRVQTTGVGLEDKSIDVRVAGLALNDCADLDGFEVGCSYDFGDTWKGGWKPNTQTVPGCVESAATSGTKRCRMGGDGHVTIGLKIPIADLDADRLSGETQLFSIHGRRAGRTCATSDCVLPGPKCKAMEYEP